MAVKLPETHLPRLLPWLEQHLPHTFKLHEELKRHLRGQFSGLDFFVDRWPHPQAVIAVRKQLLSKEDTASRAKSLRMVEGVFGVSDQAVSDLLKDPTVLTWDTCVIVCAVTESLKPVILEVTQEMGKSARINPVFLLKATTQDLKHIPVPEGTKLQPVSSADIKMIHSTWRHGSEVPQTYIEEFVQHFPSVFLVTENGRHVGHMLGMSSGVMGMLDVNPEFRRKGYAKVIVSQLAQKYFDRGEDAYVFVEEENTPSLNLHQDLGFRVASERKFVLSYLTNSSVFTRT